MGKKISQLPSGTAISGPELFPAVQSGTTKKFTLASLMSWIVGVITPTSIGAQPKITASGILKGDGAGGVSAATAGTDYAIPSQLEAKANQSQLAVVESGSTASRAYAVGEYFCWGGVLYRATAAISSGGTFTPGTNCEYTTVGSELQDKPKNMVFNLQAGKTLTITKTTSSVYSYLISGAGPTAFNALWWVTGYSNTGTQTRLVTLNTANNLTITNGATAITIQNTHPSSGARVTVLVLGYEGTLPTYTVS